jgi:hypothetical protein
MIRSFNRLNGEFQMKFSSAYHPDSPRTHETCGWGDRSAWFAEKPAQTILAGAEENTNLFIIEIVALFVTEGRNHYISKESGLILRRAAG